MKKHTSKIGKLIALYTFALGAYKVYKLFSDSKQDQNKNEKGLLEKKAASIEKSAQKSGLQADLAELQHEGSSLISGVVRGTTALLRDVRKSI